MSEYSTEKLRERAGEFPEPIRSSILGLPDKISLSEFAVYLKVWNSQTKYQEEKT